MLDRKHIAFSGRLVIVGFGSIGQGVLPLLLRHLEIRPDQKLVVAMMSSYDEYIAARAIDEVPSESEFLFPSQLEWIRALIEWFKTRPALFLLIRVHPREFPNKREATKSAHALLLEHDVEIEEIPPRAAVEDGVEFRGEHSRRGERVRIGVRQQMRQDEHGNVQPVERKVNGVFRAFEHRHLALRPKARQELGWTPNMSYDAMLEDMIAAHLERLR